MSAKHRKASKLAAKRTGIAATAVGATAAIGLMGAPTNAAAPDYSKAISDYSHALDNFLNASNNFTNSAGSVWNPIAGQTGGILPTFSSGFEKVDATTLRGLATVLENIGKLRLPTAVPGVVPNVVLPGGNQLDLSTILPTTLPGGQVLVGAGGLIKDVLGVPVVGPILDGLPPLSGVINGLELTQSSYFNKYDWKLLGLNGQTNFLNTFLKTPSGVALNITGLTGIENDDLAAVGIKSALSLLLLRPVTDLTDVSILPAGTLPSGTVWVPQGDGTYNFPLGGQLGWWAAAPTAALKIPGWLGGSETVLSVPIGAAGMQLPLGLAKAGVLSGSVLLPTQNGVYSPVGLTMTNVNTILPIGFTNINVTTGNYVGTNGINVNNGQNLLLLQNPLGVPLPILYGLGGFNFGVEGAGLTSPSLFGIKLFSDNLLQLGTQTGPNSSAGLIPPDILPTDPLSQIITGVTSPLGVSSLTQLLGIDAFIKPVMTAFGPVYQAVSAVTLKPLSDFATSQYGPFVNNSASQLLDLSKTLSEQTGNLPGAPASTGANTAARTADFSAPSQTDDGTGTPSTAVVDNTTGDHSLEKGGEPLPDLLARLQGSKDGDKAVPVKADPAPEPVVDTPTPAPAPDPAPAPEPSKPEVPAEPSAPEPTAPEPVTAPAATESTSTTSSASTDTGTADAGTTEAGTDKAA